jgi:diguanylate cyclase (GGDEF)-like protein/PAS domain S-box-containing protein
VSESERARRGTRTRPARGNQPRGKPQPARLRRGKRPHSAELPIGQSDERFRTTFDLLPVGISHIDPDGRILLANPLFGKMLGYPADELVGRNIGDFVWHENRTSADRLKEERAELYAGKISSFDTEVRYRHKDGSAIWGALTVALLRDAQGRPLYEVSAVNDVTARKREDRLRNLEHAVTRCLAEAEGVAEALQAVMREVCESEGWDSGRYFRWDSESGLLRFSSAWGRQSAAVRDFLNNSTHVTFRPGEGLSGRVYESGEPMWVPDVSKDPRTLKTVPAHMMRSVFVFPVVSDGKVIGVLGFSSGEIRQPDERLLGAARVIGSQIGQFVRRAQMEDAVRESEERFRSLNELSSDMYWEQDDQYRFTSFSGPGPEWLLEGRRRSVGKRRWDQDYLNMTPADWVEHIALLDARKPFQDLELCRIDESGKKVWISISGEAVSDVSGNFKGYRGVGKDITARKRAEELQALEHTVNRSLAGAQNASAAVRAAIRAICETEGWECGRYFRLDEKAGMLRFGDSWSVANPEVERFIEGSRGLTYEAGVGLAGKVWQSGEPVWVADITRDARVAQPGLARSSGMHGAFVFPVVSEGRTIGVLAFNTRSIREPEERLLEAIRVIGSQVGQFLERKQAQEELQRFRLAMDNSGDMIWLIDPVAMRIVDVNNTACRALGYSREEVLTMGPHEIVHASREALAEIYQRVIAGDMTDATVAGFYRHKDGTRIPMESTRRAVRSSEGHLIVAVARDTSERRRREEELRRFRLAMDNSADIMVLVDRATMRFIDVNTTACKLLGYSREELLEMGPHDLLPLSRTDLERSYDELIANPSLTSGMKTWYRCKDGSPLPFESTRHVLRSGDTYIIAAVSRDIRERIASEAALKDSNERLREQARQQRQIAEFGQEVLASADLTDVLARAVELVSGTLNVEYCDVLEFDSDHKRLLYKAAVGWPREWVGRRAVDLVPGGNLEHSLLSRETVVIEDLQNEKRFAPSALIPLGIRSTMRTPILGTKGVFGVFGVHSKNVRRFTEEEVSFLRNVANILAVAIERRNAEERLAYLAQFDALTGLPNRHLFHDRLLQTMAGARRSGRPMAVLYADLDRFKLVNDTQGHGAGDKLLKKAAERLLQCVRSGDTVGRFGGDEFAAVLSDLARPGDASLVAQKIIEALAQPFDLDGYETYVSASVGITLFPSDGEEAGTLIMNADSAMYRAKEQGRNTYQYFTREMNERALARSQMDAALRRAIERKEFLLHYQPKVDLATGSICGFEALLRWQHPERGMVSPVEFIPVLEDTGLIVPVGEWVLREVCEQIQTWDRAGLAVLPVAVNLSARQFQQKDLESSVRGILKASGVDPSLVQIELTESLLMIEPEAAARTLRGLKEAGVTISVDDFGTGYSSLAYLKRFPIDALKIDRAFIREVTTNPEDAAITLAIIGLAHSLKLKVVAEGVETEGQLNFLSQHACDEMQGFYFARPAAPSECEAMLRQGRRLDLSAEGAPTNAPACSVPSSKTTVKRSASSAG